MVTNCPKKPGFYIYVEEHGLAEYVCQITINNLGEFIVGFPFDKHEYKYTDLYGHFGKRIRGVKSTRIL